MSAAGPRFQGRRLPTTVLPLAALALLPVLAVRPVSDVSPWLHLRIGQFLAAGDRFGTPDPWAPLASQAYVPTQWLPSILTAELYDRFGVAVVVWERAATIGLLALALYLWARSEARTWVATPVTAVALFAAWPGLTERPQLAGFVLLVPVLAAWWRTAHDLRPRWWLVPLTWLSASTHGIWATGAAIGGLLVLAVLASRRPPRPTALRLLGLLGACGVAAAVTPLGPGLLLTPFSVGSQGRQFVGEWLPSSVRSPHVLAALGLLAVAWLCWVRLRRRPEAWELVLLVTACVLALTMQRTVPVAAFVGLPLAASAIEAALRARAAGSSVGPPDPDIVTAAARHVRWRAPAAATLVGLLIALPVAAARDDVRGVPAALLPQLTSYPAGTRMVAFGDLTGWLLLEAPALAPVQDIRIEVYSPEHVRDYIGAVAAEPGWDDFVEGTGAVTALLPHDAPLVAALTEQLRWREVGRDDGFVLLEASP
jgi:hypothetical protein